MKIVNGSASSVKYSSLLSLLFSGFFFSPFMYSSILENYVSLVSELFDPRKWLKGLGLMIGNGRRML